MRIAVSGTRSFDDYLTFSKYFEEFIRDSGIGTDVTLMSGHCKGTDQMCERYARENNIAVEIYPADWRTYGRAAGPIRNKLIAERCDLVIAFWDGRSKGTLSMIKTARKLSKPVYIIRFDK